MNIILCGLPKAGKTTLGKKLAKQMSCTCLDTDRLMESLYFQLFYENKTCREIFTEKGEITFRELEKEVIKGLDGVSHSVISLGAGAVQDQENIQILKSIGTIIYIKVPMHILLERVTQDIPAFIDTNDPVQSYKKLAKKRVPIYEKIADHTVDWDDPYSLGRIIHGQ